MLSQIKSMAEEALQRIAASKDSQELEQVRVLYLGKKGLLTQILRGLGEVVDTDRPLVGQAANQTRLAIEEALQLKLNAVTQEEQNRRLARERIDITLPGRRQLVGREHVLSQVLEEIKEIFWGLGYAVAEGPEIELDYYNFEALNLPKDHPARDMQDSFYISEDVLLRTHTSPVQVRVMQATAPELPIKVIAPGKVYRRDDDATHSPMFHQVEGLLVDHGVSFADLKGTLLAFARRMFGEERQIRLRPSFFPFTEPSAEVDISCLSCGGAGCRVCSHTGWLEILGCGLMHPRVLAMGGYDPEQVSAFAFGMGVERIAMLKYGIDDLRLLFENDVRFLEQF